METESREERKTGISILMLCPVFLQDQGLKANHLTASVMKGLQAEWLALIQKPRKRSVSYFYGRYAQLLFLVSFYLLSTPQAQDVSRLECVSACGCSLRLHCVRYMWLQL